MEEKELQVKEMDDDIAERNAFVARMLEREETKTKKADQGGKFLLIYICNFHVLSNLLLIYICKLHWNSRRTLCGSDRTAVNEGRSHR